MTAQTAHERLRIEVIVMAETATAIQVAMPSRAARGTPVLRSAWLPKQLVTIENEAADGGATLVIARALAETRGLV